MPGAILLAGALVAGAVIFTNSGSTSGLVGGDNSKLTATESSKFKEALTAVAGITKVNDKDHYSGNLKAKVQIVEFSDMDCPYCKRFNGELDKAVAAYGDKIGVIYRHFPLTQLHPNASKEAEATECAAELGGNDAFGKFFKEFESEIAGGKTYSSELMSDIAVSIGLDKAQFESCLASDRPGRAVAEDVKDGNTAGVSGTPFSIILKNGKPVDLISGAYPFEETQGLDDCSEASIYVYSLRNSACAFKSVLDGLVK